MAYETTVSRNFHSILMYSFKKKMQPEKQDYTQHKRSNYTAKLYSHSLKVASIILHIRGQSEGTAASTHSFLIHRRITSPVKYQQLRTNETMLLEMFTVYCVPKFSIQPSNMKIKYHCNFLNRFVYLKSCTTPWKYFNCQNSNFH